MNPPRGTWGLTRPMPHHSCAGRSVGCRRHSDRVARAQERGGVSRPRLAALTYAATSTLICLGLASSRSGSRTVSMPALYSALTLPASTVGGSANVRANEP